MLCSDRERPIVSLVQLAHRGREKRKDGSVCILRILYWKDMTQKIPRTPRQVSMKLKQKNTFGIEPRTAVFISKHATRATPQLPLIILRYSKSELLKVG